MFILPYLHQQRTAEKAHCNIFLSIYLSSRTGFRQVRKQEILVYLLQSEKQKETPFLERGGVFRRVKRGTFCGMLI